MIGMKKDHRSELDSEAVTRVKLGGGQRWNVLIEADELFQWRQEHKKVVNAKTWKEVLAFTKMWDEGEVLLTDSAQSP